MSITAWSSFQRFIAPTCAGVPWPLAQNALLDASSEFFERSLAWKTEPLVAFNTTQNVATATPTLPGLIVKVIALRDGTTGRYLKRIRHGLIESAGFNDTGTPVEYQMVDNSTVELFPTPDAVYSLQINAAMKPDKTTATGIDSVLFENYGEQIASGALARLLAMPGKEWANPELAAVHLGRFNEGINRAIYKDTQGTRPRARPRMF